MVQVVDQFDFDPRSLREDEAIGGLDGLVRRFADERFADLGIDRDELAELLAARPARSVRFRAIIRQYAHRRARADRTDGGDPA